MEWHWKNEFFTPLNRGKVVKVLIYLVNYIGTLFSIISYQTWAWMILPEFAFALTGIITNENKLKFLANWVMLQQIALLSWVGCVHFNLLWYPLEQLQILARHLWILPDLKCLNANLGISRKGPLPFLLLHQAKMINHDQNFKASTNIFLASQNT